MTELEWFQKYTDIQDPHKTPIDRLTRKVVETLLNAIDELPPQLKCTQIYMLVAKIQQQSHAQRYPHQHSTHL